jgi:hypothetical protein
MSMVGSQTSNQANDEKNAHEQEDALSHCYSLFVVWPAGQLALR